MQPLFFDYFRRLQSTPHDPLGKRNFEDESSDDKDEDTEEYEDESEEKEKENKPKKLLKVEMENGIEVPKEEEENREKESLKVGVQRLDQVSREEDTLVDNHFQSFIAKQIQGEREAFENFVGPSGLQPIDVALKEGFDPVHDIFQTKRKNKTIKDIQIAQKRLIRNAHVLGLAIDYLESLENNKCE